jgi:hypothetical protein
MLSVSVIVYGVPSCWHAKQQNSKVEQVAEIMEKTKATPTFCKFWENGEFCSLISSGACLRISRLTGMIEGENQNTIPNAKAAEGARYRHFTQQVYRQGEIGRNSL